MVKNEVAATVLATMGTICWCVQLIPQIILNYRRRSTKGLSGVMMLVWAISGVPLGIYNIVQNLNIALQIQPQLFAALALVSWAQTLYYGDGDLEKNKRWHNWRPFVLVIVVGAFMGGVETAGILGIRVSKGDGVRWPITFMGVLDAVMINGGLLPQFWEIYKLRDVVGVSYLFLAIDCSGGLLSFLSLPFEGHWDVIASISYGLLFVLEIIIFILAFMFALIRRFKARPESEAEKELESANVPPNAVRAQSQGNDASGQHKSQSE